MYCVCLLHFRKQNGQKHFFTKISFLRNVLFTVFLYERYEKREKLGQSSICYTECLHTQLKAHFKLKASSFFFSIRWWMNETYFCWILLLTRFFFSGVFSSFFFINLHINDLFWWMLYTAILSNNFELDLYPPLFWQLTYEELL